MQASRGKNRNKAWVATIAVGILTAGVVHLLIGTYHLGRYLYNKYIEKKSGDDLGKEDSKAQQVFKSSVGNNSSQQSPVQNDEVKAGAASPSVPPEVSPPFPSEDVNGNSKEQEVKPLATITGEVFPTQQTKDLPETKLTSTEQKEEAGSGPLPKEESHSDIEGTQKEQRNIEEQKKVGGEQDFANKPIKFSEWVLERVKDVPQISNTIPTLKNINKVFAEQKGSLVYGIYHHKADHLSSQEYDYRYVGFKLDVEYISLDPTHQRKLLTPTIVGVLSSPDGKGWTIRSGIENVKFISQSAGEEEYEDECLLLGSFGSHNVSMDLTAEQSKIFAQEEEQDSLLNEEDRKNLAWVMFRLLSGSSVKIVARKVFDSSFPTTNPDGYWRITLAIPK